MEYHHILRRQQRQTEKEIKEYLYIILFGPFVVFFGCLLIHTFYSIIY